MHIRSIDVSKVGGLFEPVARFCLVLVMVQSDSCQVEHRAGKTLLGGFYEEGSGPLNVVGPHPESARIPAHELTAQQELSIRIP